MTTLLLGANGQLGRDLAPLLGAVPLARADADLDRPETLEAALTRFGPRLVVNCAAYNLVDKAEDDPEPAFRTNAWGVRTLAQVCRKLGATLVHFSTDYVFGLDATDPARGWVESDRPGPLSVYGQSKLCGEYAALAGCPDSLVIRTCGLYGVWGSGGKGTNFVETMLRLAGQGKPLKVVADQRCTPTYTADLAVLTAQLISRGVRGLVHATNLGACSWYEFAAEIFRQAGVTADLSPTTAAAFGAKAARPSHSVLASEVLAAHGVPPMRPWQEALAAYLAARSARLASAANA